MGIMIGQGKSPSDVLRWPDDPAARGALRNYLEALGRDSEDLGPVLDGWGLDFTGADLSGLELVEAEFSHAVLKGVRLVGANLSGAWLMETALSDADLSQCNLKKARARRCHASGAIFRGADVQRAEFEDADFRRADLSHVRFGGAWFSGADLRGASLRECVFGLNGQLTGFPEARFAECDVDGVTGTIAGPVDVGADSPHLLDGPDLQRWFAERGAPLMEVREIVQP